MQAEGLLEPAQTQTPGMLKTKAPGLRTLLLVCCITNNTLCWGNSTPALSQEAWSVWWQQDMKKLEQELYLHHFLAASCGRHVPWRCLQYFYFSWSDLMSNLAVLPAASSPPSLATTSCCPWHCLPSHVVNWERELNPWENSHCFLYFLFIFLFFLFWLLLPEVVYPFHPTTLPGQYSRRDTAELIASKGQCRGQLEHPVAHREPDQSFTQFRDPLPAMAIKYILISMSATTCSHLNCP